MCYNVPEADIYPSLGDKISVIKLLNVFYILKVLVGWKSNVLYMDLNASNKLKLKKIW